MKDSIKCPACQSNCKLSFTIADVEKTEWIFCKCGTIFHQKQVDLSYYNDEWITNYKKWKGIKDRYEYIERVYFDIVGELTYGRRFLEIGFGADYHIKNLADKGWKSTGIDVVANEYITGDIEEYDFKDEKYDFIFVSGVLGGLKDPIKTIYKVKEMLNDNGILMVIDADAELVYERGMWDFGNWNPKERNIIFSETQIKKILELLDLKVVVSHKNISERFMNWNTYHIIAQKKEG